MEYIYGAMLLHAAGKEITDENLEKVLKAAGVEPDSVRIKGLTASLKDVNIEEAISTAAVVSAPAASAPAAPAAGGDAGAPAAEDKKEEKKEEEEEVSEEEAAAGLGALFG